MRMNKANINAGAASMLLALVLVVLCFGWAGYKVLTTPTKTAALQTEQEKVVAWGPGRNPVRVVTDNQTGCQYLVYRQQITPRMDPNGKQVCVE